MKQSKMPKATGVALAMAAAGMLGACQSTPTTETSSAATAKTDLVHCYGVNKCSGHNDCKTANNACAGHASCKGQGFVAMPSKACGHAGGTIEDSWKGTIAKADLVHCYGVNKCGGHNDCKTANNACKGHASCKGQGFLGMSAKTCDHVGGEEGV